MSLEYYKSLNRMIRNMSVFSKNVIDHCKIEWTLENFLFADTNNLIFESPKFDLARSLSSWYLLIKPEYKHDKIIIFLHRNHEDVGLRIVNVSLRFGLKDVDTVNWQEEINREIRCGNFEVCFLENISKYLNFHTKQITVVCQMIVSGLIITSVPQNVLTDASELAFLNDFRDLYSTTNFSDITLCVAGIDLKAHKAIIANRSAVFKNMLSGENNNLSVLKLSEVSLKDVKFMLQYMYATNLSIFLKFCQISLSSYDCFEKFDIADLKHVLAPSDVKIDTKIVVDVNEFKWKIEKFSKICKNDAEFNINYNLKVGLRRFRLHIDCSPQNDYIILIVECLDFDSPMSIYLDISFFKADGKRTKLPKVIEKRKLFGIPLFANKELFLRPKTELFPNDILTIFCRIKTTNCDAKHQIINKYNASQIKNKSESFKSLLESGDYSDLTLISSDQKFLVHKAVLAARSVYFRKLLVNFEKSILYINDLSPRALRTLLLYIYSGKLEDDLESAFEIFKVSDKYSVTILDVEIQNYFTSKFNPEEVCEIALKADFFKEKKLKYKAIKYIGLNFDIIGMSPFWDELVERNKKLASEILSVFTVVYNKSASIKN